MIPFVMQYPETVYTFVDAVLAILVFSGMILLPVLLPVAATDDGAQSTTDSNSGGTFKNLDKLAMGNVQVSFDGPSAACIV